MHECTLAPHSAENRPIEIIATWSNGDARVALQTVRAAAVSADAKRREVITIDDVKDAIKGARKSKLEYVKSKLNEHQKFLLEQIEKSREIDSGELFRKYEDNFQQPLGERAYRNQMEHLVQTGLIRETGEGRWRTFTKRD